MPEQIVLTCKTFREVPKLIIKKGKMMQQENKVAVEAEAKKKRQAVEMTEPNYLLMAAEKFGMRALAEELGYDYSSIAAMVKNKRCRPVAETAARFLLLQAASKENTAYPTHYVVTVPAGGDVSVLEKLAEPLGWSLTPLPVR